LVDALVHYYDDLIDHVRRRFGDRGFAREVLHDVCVQLIERPPRDIQQPHAFLRHIATQRAIDRYRGEKTRTRVVIDLVEMPDGVTTSAHAPMSSVELNIAFQQKQQALLLAIRALPECCRDVFILHKLYHMPQADVAARLGISRGMVARHMARAVVGVAPVMNAQ
jgi:RNA polymerase sigma-70 factor (ECF subfamily)